MANPPKKIAKITATDSSATPKPASSTSGRSPNIGGDSSLSRTDSATHLQTPRTSSSSIARQPAVVLSGIPDSALAFHDAARGAIAWPQERWNELTAIAENSGLFTGPDQRTYAQIGDEGRFAVEQNLPGNYYLPLSFALGIAGPLLTRIKGQASWRIQRPDGQSASVRGITPAASLSPSYLSAADANTLTKPELATDGLRYNKLKQTFVTTVDGTVMVRKNTAGEYQQAFASTNDAPPIFFEQIAGTVFWRRKPAVFAWTETALASRPRPTEPDDAIPGPSKRPRLAEPAQTLARPSPEQSDQTPYFWLPWGRLNTPPAVPSVQLGWLHYPIVPVGSNPAPKVYFVLHPEFFPTDFNSFEHMLRTAPQLQPVATFRIGNDPGEIHPGKRFFEAPISTTVGQAFPDFSDHTARAVARRLFELADHSLTITGTGLVNIHTALNQWKQRPFSTAPEFADPVSMLAVAPDIEVRGKRLIPMPSQADSELQRLTFDPQRFAVEWAHYKTYPTELNLRRLLGALLVRSGYEVFPLTYEHRVPTLVFKRANHDRVFFLKLGSVDQAGLSHTPGNELTEPSLPARIGAEAFAALTVAAAQHKVTWLIGGVLKVDGIPDSVFIIRER